MMLDATKGDVQKTLLQKELESVGIRLNTKKPNIYFKVNLIKTYEQIIFSLLKNTLHWQHKKGGGIAFNAVCPLTKVDEKLVQLILHEYKIFNAEVIFHIS
jgi:ribosome-interacting GTPase 1